MKDKGYWKFRLSFSQIFGIILICTGLFMIWYFGIETVKKKELPDKSITDEDLQEYAEMQEDMKTRWNNALRIPMVILGGVLILASIPLFYAPYDDKGLKLRWKIKKREKPADDDDENLKDPEFDYPDDDFDFIIRREIYELLHKEQLENIRKKRNKK
ncbi:MAG: DUF3899 domain-containing protein [Ruminococcus sp.]|nr:DUF3899 domain-containing protein [Ruminococcus sp.]